MSRLIYGYSILCLGLAIAALTYLLHSAHDRIDKLGERLARLEAWHSQGQKPE